MCFYLRCLVRSPVSDIIENARGEVSELADEHDLESCAGRRAGSNPAFPIGGARSTLAPYFVDDRVFLDGVE
jgi:hypothetical protein